MDPISDNQLEQIPTVQGYAREVYAASYLEGDYVACHAIRQWCTEYDPPANLIEFMKHSPGRARWMERLGGDETFAADIAFGSNNTGSDGEDMPVYDVKIYRAGREHVGTFGMRFDVVEKGAPATLRGMFDSLFGIPATRVFLLDDEDVHLHGQSLRTYTFEGTETLNVLLLREEDDVAVELGVRTSIEGWQCTTSTESLRFELDMDRAVEWLPGFPPVLHALPILVIHQMIQTGRWEYTYGPHQNSWDDRLEDLLANAVLTVESSSPQKPRFRLTLPAIQRILGIICGV